LEATLLALSKSGLTTPHLSKQANQQTASQWDAEGIQLRADAPARTKKELDAQVPAQFKARFGVNDTKMMINPLEIVVNGPWAFSRGTIRRTDFKVEREKDHPRRRKISYQS